MTKLNFKYRIFIKLVNLLSKTWRFHVNDNMPTKPAIILFWHGLMLPGWKFYEGRDANALVSTSKDGELLTNILQLWGFNVLRGSSSQQGKEALEQMIALAPEGFLLITPDGPRGPSQEMKAGAVVTSVKSQVPIYLCGIKIAKKITFKKSWDKFELPLPFSKIELTFDGPYLFPQSSNREEISSFIQVLNSKLLYLLK
ncbi:MAG: DUF374 domain-containing protein [Desulfobulbaceae bacterium]|nr:DUF374 domain-containing protein [Candidatus Kapabacteria bacterium]MBS4001628.1 DUF374 domain-containing protein [Desulfobulbaceae bacterium]